MGSFEEYTYKKLKKDKKEKMSFQEYTESLFDEKEKEDDIAPLSEVFNLRMSNGIITEGAREAYGDIRRDTVPVIKNDDKLDFFQKGAFEDGYQFGDVTKSILGTAGDAGVGIVKGGAGLVEGLLDAGSYLEAGVADLFGADEYAENLRKQAQKNSVQESFAGVDNWLDQYSVLGRTSDGITQGLGQVGTIILTGGIGAGAGLGTAGVTALTTGTMGVSSMGSGMSDAYNYSDEVTHGEAFAYGLSKGAIDAGTELLFGGLGKAVGAVGLSKGISSLDDVFAQKLSSRISNQFYKNLVEYGVKASGEGVEEWLAGLGTSVAKWLTYADEEELRAIIEDENLLEQFVVGTVTSGMIQSGVIPGTSNGSLKDANAKGTDFITGYTQNEQSVLDRLVENEVKNQETDGKKLTKKEIGEIEKELKNSLERGEIEIDTIESVLGGETYTEYDSLLKEAQEFEELYNTKNSDLSKKQEDRLAELTEKNKKSSYEVELSNLREKLSQEVRTKTENDTFLLESYNEKAKRSKTYEADLTKYDEKMQETVKKAIDSGILNDTKKTHDFVDMLAKLSAEKGVSFDFMNNTKLKESGFAIEGKTINGLVKGKNDIALNINSKKALNTVVGHEITHVLEGTDLYTELQTAITEYAKTKGDYDSRLEAITKLYEGVENVNIENELTADLVGDYLFTDSNFVNNLSTTKPNVFKKIYNEIKYLLKLATAGSQEARQLEKVKKTFDKAFKETTSTKEDSRPHYDMSEDTNLLQYVKDALSNKLPKKSYYKISETISDKMANDIENIVGFSVKGYGNEISPGSIRHINNEHGENGRTDQSMKDFHDLAKVSYVIDNYDTIKEGKVSKEFKNSDGTYSKTVELQKKIDDGFYYVVEAVPDAKNKTLHVVSAYINKKDTFSVVDNAISPIRDVQNEPQSNVSYENSIPQNTKITSGTDVQYSLSEDSEGRTISPAVQKRFANSKAVDENGSLKVLYHGTPSGEFTIFDKSKGSIEGDFGSGFYFTDNETDVEVNYEGGGPDFENKVARRAEQIEAEEEIDYDEAEQRAREELYKGSNKFEVYLNIENPAIVGETVLMTEDKYLEEYDPDDYDDYDDYLADVEQLLADDIENIVWEVEKNVDLYSTDGIADVLYNAYYEGGIEIEDLKARINELYLEDNEGNLAGNEVTRQIIESLGYDGIIDSTVSSKFSNMGLEEGTTHYIVFKPNQIKSITNQNPTDNPDINLSLSSKNDIAPTGKYNVYGKDIALETVSEMENVAPLVQEKTDLVQEVVQETDEYAPMTEAEANERDAMQSDRLYSLNESDMPEEIAPMYDEELGDVEAVSPFDDKDIKEVGDRKQKAYMYENPEVKPYFQEEAQNMLYELKNSVKGERVVDANLLYESGGEFGVWGTKRETSEQIAYMLDRFKYSYADIEKGLNAIIKDHGAENNAISKRLEFMIDERLREGYTDFLSGMQIPSNQDYINLLRDKQINSYTDEAYNQYIESLASEFANEDIAPTQAYEAIEPEPQDLDALEEQWAKNKMVRADSNKEAEKIAKILDAEPVTENDRNRRKWAIFKANVFDKGAVFEDLALKTKNRNLIGKWNYTLYSESRAQRLMGEGDTEAGVKSLNDIRAEVENTGLTKQFYEYMYHKHNVDRMSLESKEASNRERLTKEIKRLKLDTLTHRQLKAIAHEKIKDSTKPERAHLISTVQEYLKSMDVKNKPVFGYSVTSEMSQEIVDQYEFAQPKFMDYAQDVYKYQNYLRQQLVDNGVISQETADLWNDMYPHYVPIRRVDSKGNNINVPLDTGRTGVNAPIKGATGGNTDILPLFDTMAMRTLQTYKATAKNSFGVELKNSLGTTVAKSETNIDDVIDSVDTQESLLQEGKHGQKPTFTVFENGERVTFEITEDMYDAFKPLSDSSLLSKTVRPLNFASNLHRGLLTEYNPVFILTNGIKDIQDVLINSQHPAKTYTKIPEAFAQLTKKGYWYNEYMNNGGDSNSYFDSDTNTFKTENKGIAKMLDLPPLSTISKLNNYVEMIPRLAEYIASREAGRSVEVSMLDSARVTTNFRAGGDLTKFLNRNGATFLNASVQGAMQQVRNFREAKANGLKGWANLATKFAIAGLPALILNALVWDDDEDYAELSDYVKQNFYIVGKYGDGQFIRIPKGRTVAVIQDAIKQVSDVATGNDEADLKSFLELVITNLAPANPIENNIIAPIIQVKNNETWYGDDLVPTRLQDLPASEQFDESTDIFSKWLGETFNVSPYKVNYLLDQYSGGLGDVILPMLTPEAESGDNSVVGNLIAPLKKKFTTDSVMNNQNIADFYDTKDELATNAKMSTATDEDVLKNKYIESIGKEMSELYKWKREIQNSDLPDDEKYKLVREVQSQIVELSKEGLQSYEGVEIYGDYAVVGDRYYTKDAEGTWKKLTDKQVEKQEEVTSGLNISDSDYWSNKEEYDYAYKNPEKYAVSKVVGGYDSYSGYLETINKIEGEKDENGKTISGSKKANVASYIFNDLDLDYGQQMILYRSIYDSQKDKEAYNFEIVEYLNGRSDISYEEMVEILESLDMKVYSDGTVSW